jgi:hypothetical protein
VHLEVPVASLAQIGDHLLLSAVRAPAGVKIITPGDTVVVTVQHSAGSGEPDETAPGE